MHAQYYQRFLSVRLRKRISKDIFGNQVQFSTISNYVVSIIFKIWTSTLKRTFLPRVPQYFLPKDLHSKWMHFRASLISVMISFY